jgi:two-component system cell cycle sensor histidine kinase PleC
VIGLGAIAITLPLIMLVMLSREISRRVNHEIALYGERDKLRSEHAAVLAMSAQLAEERIKLRATNAQLVSARRRAEEASRAKSIFLANISHELRTPLNAIIGFAQMIRDRVFGDDTHRYAEYADDIYSSGRHLLCIINGLLDMAKIEAGKLKLDETLMKLDEIVRECMGAVQSLAAKSKIELNVNLPDSGIWLRADETKLKQIIINLLSNAVKFTPAGGKVTFSAERDQDGSLILTISDTGIGMSPEEAQCALELFRQLDNPMSRRCEGTGLGLPLAVQLTELHGGSFRIESVPGSGTSIFIRLPAGRAWEDGQPSTKTCVQPPPHPQAQDSRSGASQELHDSGQDLKAKP